MVTSRLAEFDHAAPTVARIGFADEQARIRRILNQSTRSGLIDADGLGELGHTEAWAFGEHAEHTVSRKSDETHVTTMQAVVTARRVLAVARLVVAFPAPTTPTECRALRSAETP